MKTEDVTNKEVVDPKGMVVGIVERVEFKEDGTYVLIVKGELDDDQRKMSLEKFGKSEGGDLFEISHDQVGGIKEKVALKEPFETLKGKLKILRHV